MGRGRGRGRGWEICAVAHVMVELRGILSKSAPPLRRIVSTHHLIRQRPLLQRRHGRKLPTQFPPLSEEKLVIAEARYEAGATLKAIASDHGISRQSLAHQLRKRGLKLRGRAPEPHESMRCVADTRLATRLKRSAADLGSRRAQYAPGSSTQESQCAIPTVAANKSSTAREYFGIGRLPEPN